ncbi:MAG: methyltransferase domain-containing protein [Selenomonadaceae bacterium]|nr:methyltransferase domain-containing protein [Selenomonadaceae bacterium]
MKIIMGGGGTINIVNGFFEERYNELQQKHFDFILCSGLLHEVENPKKLLSAIFSVADKDSIIHINVPNAKSFHRLLALESGLISSLKEFSDRNKMMQQHSVFDLEDLKNLIVEIAFKNQNEVEFLDSGSYFLKPFTHSQMAACLSNRIFGEQVLEGFYKIVKYMPELGCEIYVNFKLKDIGG